MKYIFILLFLAVAVTAGAIFISSNSNKHQDITPVVTISETLPISLNTQPEKISLEEKVGQMLIVGFRGTSVTENSSIVKKINKLHLGGVVLFDFDTPSGGGVRNITGRTQLTKLTASLKKLTSDNLIISIDLEGGLVNRLKTKYGFVNFPSAQSLGKLGDLAYTEEVAQSIGEELAGVGITMDFAPDVDVDVNPKNPVIGAVGRSFSSDPDKVVLQARAFIKGLHKKNILSVIKHFPGHGSSTADSHLGFVDITKTYKQEELIPFKELKDDADAIMVAHVTNTKIDPNYPASLSRKFITDILRNQLKYDGLVISDDISMGAITKNYTLPDAVVHAINAGNDMLIISNNVGKVYDENLPDKIVSIVLGAIKDGTIQESTVDEAYVRIQAVKNKF